MSVDVNQSTSGIDFGNIISGLDLGQLIVILGIIIGIVIVGGMIYYTFVKKSEEIEDLKTYKPSTPVDKKAIGVFDGSEGPGFIGKIITPLNEVLESSINNIGATFIIEELYTRKRIILTNVAPNDIDYNLKDPRWMYLDNPVVFFRIDAGNKRHDWRFRGVKIKELSEITKMRMEVKMRQKILKEIEQRNIITESMPHGIMTPQQALSKGIPV